TPVDLGFPPPLWGRDREGGSRENGFIGHLRKIPCIAAGPPRRRRAAPETPPSPTLPHKGGGSTAGLAARSCANVSSSHRRDLDRARPGSAEAIGTIHVLDIGLRQHIFAGRHRTHHVSDGEDRGIFCAAIERRAETIVAELRIDGFGGVLDPTKLSGV